MTYHLSLTIHFSQAQVHINKLPMAFGLDIGTESIKVLQIAKHGDKFAISGAGIIPTPGNGMFSDAEEDIIEVAKAVKKIIATAQISSTEVNISLPESLVFTRLVRFPYLTDNELASAIAWQSEPYIPIPVDEASIDYQIFRKVEPKGQQKGYVDVLLVAASKSLVEKYIKMAEMVGVEVVSIESELLALVRALSPTQPAVLVDIGAGYTKIGIAVHGVLVISRSISTAGRVLTKAIAQGLGVSLKQAEEYKRTYGLLENQLEGKIADILDAPIRIIADEVKKAIQYYKTEVEGIDETITQVFVAGGTAGLPDIAPFLAEKLGMEVVIADPFANLIKDERITEEFLEYAPLYTVALGLAKKEA